MDVLKEIAGHFELHSPQGIATCFAQGLRPEATCNGRTLLAEFIGEYTRSSRFSECVQVLVDNGVKVGNAALEAVLLNDPERLKNCIQSNNHLLHEKYSFQCAYTPLSEVTLLHICAEFNLVETAQVLVKSGADVNARAGVDEFGFGGQTPIFHTVNQNNNRSADMLDFLLRLGVDLHLTVPGLIWGKGYPWETLLPAVNPLSYAMMGLLPQMHRDEKVIAETVSQLLESAYGIQYMPGNIPNAYLRKS